MFYVAHAIAGVAHQLLLHTVPWKRHVRFSSILSRVVCADCLSQ
jgi:hypothetical protein